ncbi:2-C-methyl-D-erythritol 2,4-cyclodiphosphate synthase [Candidatus Acetothermia bacterium]|nr:2-C-methyl-D-erythritol 2,4-cyclodiphosphate synthase [Candidatus Acetothermia bacterium]
MCVRRKLVLGGIEIPFEQGLAGHSDADVLLHAICDALLGAAALGDIGQHFPDTDTQFKDISSLKLLGAVKQKLVEKKLRPHNIDSVVIAEAPQLAPFIPAMVREIARILDLPSAQISIKATTAEKMGALGRREGIAAQAVVTLIEG